MDIVLHDATGKAIRLHDITYVLVRDGDRHLAEFIEERRAPEKQGQRARPRGEASPTGESPEVRRQRHALAAAVSTHGFIDRRRVFTTGDAARPRCACSAAPGATCTCTREAR